MKFHKQSEKYADDQNSAYTNDYYGFMAGAEYVNSLLEEITNVNYASPFRIGRKQERAIVDANGKELIVFKSGDEKIATFLCNCLNLTFDQF
jgi:hypothetical protein